MKANQSPRRSARGSVSSESQPPAGRVSTELRGLLQRAAFALGPLGTGLLLDLLDLATFGPIGLVLGAAIGGYAGWVLGKYEGIQRELRLAFAICTAAYMMIPFTEPVPAATILLLLARFFLGPDRKGWAAEQQQDSRQERSAGGARHHGRVAF